MTQTMHKDVVKNEWLVGEQRFVKRLAAEDPDEGNTSGTYWFTTEAHTDEDCPFKDGPVVPMRRMNTEGGLTN